MGTKMEFDLKGYTLKVMDFFNKDQGILSKTNSMEASGKQ